MNHVEPATDGALLRVAVERAMNAFWTEFATHYPTATHGDLSPATESLLMAKATVTAGDWVRLNVPRREWLWRRLCEHYGANPDDTCLGGITYGPEAQRFAAVALEFDLGQSDARASLGSYPTFEEACDGLSSAVLDGYAPEAVYDLDKGERIDVHIASPVITRAEDQMGENVLTTITGGHNS